jgi:hypothetical protein
MKDLIQYLGSIQPGSVIDTMHLEPLLAASWHEFDGGGAEGMAGDKLPTSAVDATASQIPTAACRRTSQSSAGVRSRAAS